MLQKAKYTNWYRDTVIETGSMINGGSPMTMKDAIAEIVATVRAIDTLVYDHTEVEQDNPDGTTNYSVIDLSDHARAELDRQIREERDNPKPSAAMPLAPKNRHGVRKAKVA